MNKVKLTTLVKSIKIEGLFGMFNYLIEYPTTENVLIITGPNGFGKTQVLNILFNLFNRKFLFFNKLVFDKITVCLSGNIKIVIDKTSISNEYQLELIEFEEEVIKTPKKDLKFGFYENEQEIEVFNYSVDLNENLIRTIDRYLPVSRISIDKWIDRRNDQIVGIDELLHIYTDQLPTEISKNILRIKTLKGNEILKSINVHLIREQRLFKKVSNPEKNYRNDREQTIMIETIQSYANELREIILERSQQSFIISQSLDSTYPNRLISEKSRVSKDEYDERFEKLKIKQDKLTRNGLYESKQKVLSYSQDDAKALLVYLNDLEQKLSVFDELLEKLELFTSILNERRFTYKSIAIDREKGFYFKTTKEKILDLNELSSGEQHEVVLLYELIFKTRPGIMVLIDEPEISLHISWQKEFLDDLLRIIKIQDFQVLIATHSPSIINDRWDLVYNLEMKD
ncbi:AAA family ATPase [uncultured Algoriphagus sp.]|uniref:AAA family ATPase n=1 Tax=uncultured Algoriphagus sp. TaxID=417365 RepID=UPI0030EE5163|tara:strand:+ start:48685 stop:50052 length:1368 start_codon:yes stop_codon:yes gene_type:complete